jgi:hypothetical protein
MYSQLMTLSSNSNRLLAINLIRDKLNQTHFWKARKSEGSIFHCVRTGSARFLLFPVLTALHLHLRLPLLAVRGRTQAGMRSARLPEFDTSGHPITIHNNTCRQTCFQSCTYRTCTFLLQADMYRSQHLRMGCILSTTWRRLPRDAGRWAQACALERGIRFKTVED